MKGITTNALVDIWEL